MIHFENVEIKYGDFTAMQNFNLEINKGEFFTFLGPSGCGKTTTLRALVGFVEPSSGTISVEGIDITRLPVEKRQIGMVFQSYALFPTMTVYENIAFGLKVKKLPAEEVKRMVYEVADKVELKNTQLQRNVSELSGGQQQRVALARALVLEPKILCLDEPLSNLDAKLRVGLRQELKRLQKNLGITTLYVTHDQEEALILSDRIAVFNNGYLAQVGTPSEIYNHSASEFVCDFIGDINRLGRPIIETINAKSSRALDPSREAFVRIEQIVNTPTSGCVSLSGQIEDFEYNGILTKYMVSVQGHTVKYIALNNVNSTLQVGQQITLYLDPAVIMQF